MQGTATSRKEIEFETESDDVEAAMTAGQAMLTAEFTAPHTLSVTLHRPKLICGETDPPEQSESS